LAWQTWLQRKAHLQWWWAMYPVCASVVFWFQPDVMPQMFW